MNRFHALPLALGFTIALGACSDSTTPVAQLVSDSTITADVAISSGDAIASTLETMAGNEIATGLATSGSSVQASLLANSPDVTRSRTCYDVNGAVVSNCIPLSSVRKIVTHVVVNGSRSGSATTTGGTTKTWSGAVHRTSDDTLTRNFTGSTETSRTHSDVATGHDTTMFSEGELSRNVAESVRDSVKAVTWNMPRSSNPWPVSGSIVRVDTVHVTVTKGSQLQSRDVVRNVSVTFPADAQGNVVLTINGKTCNLNLVTHVVSGCQ